MMKAMIKNATEYKKALIGWLGIYMLITPLIYILNDAILCLPIYLQTLILTAISTPLMHILIPLLNSFFLKEKKQ